MKYADDTGEFVPINVSLSGKNAEYEDDPAMQQEYYPDQEPEQPPQRSGSWLCRRKSSSTHRMCGESAA